MPTIENKCTMTRNQFNQNRQDTLKAVCNIVDNYHRFSAPPYKLVIYELNKQGLKSSWGNYWTMPSYVCF
jgi:phage terminase large subunit-like protein